MRSSSFVILVIGVLTCVMCSNLVKLNKCFYLTRDAQQIAFADDTVEPDQCYGPPPVDFRMSPDSCCKKPIFKPEIRECLNKTRQVIIKRFHEARDNKNEGQTETPVSADEGCLANCFSSKDIFQNDEINRDELIKVLETQTEDSAWNSIHSEAVDKCIEVLQPDIKTIKSSKPERQCNQVAVLVLICLNGQYFARCPATHFQNDNENCKKFQEHIKTCPMPRGGPFGGHFGHGKKGFGGGKGDNFRSGFGPGPYGRPFGGGHFGGGHFGAGHSGGPPNFATGEVFGFL